MRLDTGMRKVGNSAVELERKTRGLASANDRLTEAGSKVDTALQNQIRQLAGMAAATVGVMAAIRQLRSSIDMFTEFEFQMSNVQAVTGATREEFKLLTDEALRLGKTTIFTAKDAAEGMQILSQAGFKTLEVISALPTVLDLALVGVMDLGTAADFTASTLRGFGIAATDAQRVADVMGVTASSTNTTVRDLGEGMKYVAPLAKALGVSLEETAAALGVLGDAGIKGTMGGTTVRGILASLVDQSEETSDVLARVHLTLKDVDPAVHGLAGSMKILKDAGADASVMMALFDKRAGAGALALVQQTEKMDRLTKSAEESKGKLREMAAIMEDTQRGSFKALESAAENLTLQFGKGLSPALRDIAQDFTMMFRDTHGAAEFGQQVGEALTVLAGALKFVIQNVEILVTSFKVLTLFKLAEWVTKGVAALGAMTSAMLAKVSITAADTVATTANTVATEVATAAVAKKSAMDLDATITYGARARQLAALTALQLDETLVLSKSTIALALNSEARVANAAAAGTQAAAAASSTAATAASTTTMQSFLALGLTPLSAGLLAVAGLLLLAGNRLKQWSSEWQREIDDMAAKTNDFATRLKAIADGTEAAIDSGDLATMGSALDTALANRAKLMDDEAKAQAEVNKLQEEGVRIQERVDAARQYPSAGDTVAALAAQTEWINKLEAAKVALQQVGIELKYNAEAQKALDKAIAGTKPPAPPPGPPPMASKHAADIEKDSAAMREEIALLKAVTAAYGISTEAGETATRTLKTESDVRKAIAEYTGEQTTELENLIRTRAKEAAIAAGSKTLAALADEQTALDKVAEAWQRGSAAAATAAREGEIAARVAKAIANAHEDQREAIEASVRAAAAREDQIANSSAYEDLNLQVMGQNALLDAYDEGSVAVAQMTRALDDEATKRQLVAGLTEKQAAELEPLIDLMIEYSHLLNFKAEMAGIEEAIDNQLSYAEALKGGAGALREWTLDQMEARAVAGGIVDPEELAMLRERNSLLLDATKLAEVAAERKQIGTDFAENLKSGMTGALKGFFEGFASGNKDALKEFGDNLKKMFMSAVADYLSRMLVALAKELLVRLANAAKVAAANQAAAAAGGGGGGGGGWLSSIGKLFGMGGGAAAGTTGGAGLGVTGSTMGQGAIVSGGAGGATGGSMGTLATLGVALAVVAAVLVAAKAIKDHADAVKYGTKVTVGVGERSGQIIGQSEGRLNETGPAIANGIKGVLHALEQAGGVLVAAMPEIELKIRNDKKLFSVWIGKEFLGQYKSAEEAMMQAAIAAFKKSSFKNGEKLDPIFESMVKNFRGKDPKELIESMAKVRSVMDGLAKLSEVEIQIRDFDNAAQTFRSELEAMGVGVQEAAALTNRWRVQQMESMRDQITGHQQTEAEARAVFERQRTAFNARLTMDKLEMEQDKAKLEADLAILQAGGTLASAEVQQAQNYLSTKNELYQQDASLDEMHLRVLGASNAAMMAIIQQAIADLNASMAAIDAIKPIDSSEFHFNGGGGGGGGAGSSGPSEREQRQQAFNDFLANQASDGLSSYQQSLESLTEAFAAQEQASREVAGGEERLAEARRVAMAQLAGELLDGFGNPMEELRDRAAEFRAQVQDVFDAFADGSIDLATFTNWMEEMRAVVQQSLMEMALYFTDAMGDTEESARLRADLAEMEWDFKKAEFAMMLEAYKLAGAINAEQYAKWKAFIDGLPEDRPGSADAGTAGVQKSALAALGTAGERVRANLADLVKKFNAIGTANAALAADLAAGRITAEEYAEAIAHADQVTGEFYAGVANDLLGMADYFAQALGDSDKSAEIRAKMAEYEYAMKLAEFAVTLETARVNHWINQELYDYLKEILDEATANPPDFTPPPPPSNGNGADEVAAERERLLEEMARQIAAWNELAFGPVTQQARELRKRYDDLVASANAAGIATGELTAAFQLAVQDFVDTALEDYRHIGEDPLARQLREIREHFADLEQAFITIGASAEQMADLEAARQAALADFWKEATADARDFLDELNATDPRTSNRERFLSLQSQFQEAMAAANSGDLSAIQRAVDLGRQLEAAGAAFYGTSSGAYGSLRDQIEEAMQQIVDMAPPELAQQSVDIQRQQLDIQTRMLMALTGEDIVGVPTLTETRAQRQQRFGADVVGEPTVAAARESAERDRRFDLLERELKAERERSRSLESKLDLLTNQIGRLAEAVVSKVERDRAFGGVR